MLICILQLIKTDVTQELPEETTKLDLGSDAVLNALYEVFVVHGIKLPDINND